MNPSTSYPVMYFSTGILDTAFDSQVLPLLERMLESGVDLIHIAVEPFRRQRTREHLEKRKELDSRGIRSWYLRQIPPFSRSSLRIDGKRMARVLKGLGVMGEKIVIHGRGHLNAARGLFLKETDPARVHVIADLRGAVVDEVCCGAKGHVGTLLSRYLRGVYQGIEDQVVRQADHILCVSNAMKEHLQGRYPPRSVTVIPTFVDTTRFLFSKEMRERLRRYLSISDRTVLVFSGGTAPWQNLDKVIDLFTGLKREIPDLLMLFLSQDPSRIKKLTKDRIDDGDLRILHVPHAEVAGYLCAADVGVLLREETLTNQVAAPIKFGEYLCCGLPCIVSAQVGDTAVVLREEGGGIIVSPRAPFPSPNEFRKLLDLDREALSRRMGKKYSSAVYVPQILELYKRVVERSGERSERPSEPS